MTKQYFVRKRYDTLHYSTVSERYDTLHVLYCTNPASEGTRLGEGSREFVLEGHRVSCLVPTSGGSGRGVNFGVFQANFSLG